MNIEEIIELLESIDQNINDGNLDDAQVDIAINLRTLYKELVKKKKKSLTRITFYSYIRV